MARLPRLVIPGQPHYLVLRGNNAQALAVDDDDRRRLLALLRDAARERQVAVHAYSLLDSELHLLLVPPTAAAPAAMVQALGRRYVPGFNRRHGRSGALWQGRFAAGVVEAGAHSLDCMCLIDSLAVLRGQASAADGSPWSSAPHHLGKRHDVLLSDPAEFWALGNTPFEREAAYAARLQHGVDAQRAAQLLHAALKGWAVGSPAFLEDAARNTGRPLRPRRRGRPARRAAGAAPPVRRRQV